MNPFMLDRNKLINLFFCVVVVVVFFYNIRLIIVLEMILNMN